MAYRGAQPSDGWAYSPIELEGLWELPVSNELIILQREKVFAFFTHCAAKFNDKRDAAIANLIARATVAEVIDPEVIVPEETADEPPADD